MQTILYYITQNIINHNNLKINVSSVTGVITHLFIIYMKFTSYRAESPRRRSCVQICKWNKPHAKRATENTHETRSSFLFTNNSCGLFISERNKAYGRETWGPKRAAGESSDLRRAPPYNFHLEPQEESNMAATGVPMHRKQWNHDAAASLSFSISDKRDFVGRSSSLGALLSPTFCFSLHFPFPFLWCSKENKEEVAVE